MSPKNTTTGNTNSSSNSAKRHGASTPEVVNSKQYHLKSSHRPPQKFKEPNEQDLLKKLLTSATIKYQQEKSEQSPVHHLQRNQHQHSSKTGRRPAEEATGPKRSELEKHLANSSANYAGGAFERAPTGMSFPVPSFLKDRNSVSGETLVDPFYSSCPLPSGPLSQKLSKDQSSRDASFPRAPATLRKSLSIHDLFGISNPSPTQATEVKAGTEAKAHSSQPANKSSESLTQDLKRLLNLSNK